MNASATLEAAKAEHKLQEILAASQSTSQCQHEHFSDFRKWFLNYFDDEKDCTLENFAVYFLNAVRQYTFQHLRTTDINEKTTIKTINDEQRNKSTLTITPTIPTTEMIGTRGNTTNLMRNSSTPVRRGNLQNQQRRSTEHRNHSAVSNNSSFDKSRNSTGDGSFCLGDFIISSPNVNNRQQATGSNKKKQQPTTITTPKSNNSGNNNKPKKRVVPISIGKTTTTKTTATTSLISTTDNNSPFGVHSRSLNSFDSNNVFMTTLATTELKDFNKNAVAEARKALNKDLNEVNTALKAAAITPTTTPTKIKDVIKPTIAEISEIAHNLQQIELKSDKEITPEEQISFEEISIEIRQRLQLLANIYALLMDMNFVINILNEFSFMLNLLNANPKTDFSIMDELNKELNGKIDSLKLLQKSINTIYFAVCVLERQNHTLTLIDIKSLGVVLQCERLECLAPSLKMKLITAYDHKQAIASNVEYHNFISGGGGSVGYVGDGGGDGSNISGFKNVCFQEDSDSRKFFPTANEFGAFKTQRDLFYIALKIWEKNHLNPAWNFSIEVSAKVRDIFRQSEHPVNMSHFSKLFVSQLLVSASDRTSPEDVGFGNDDVDLQKFNKLTQRLVAPSNFSVDYQFPREQAFFRDFIVESRSLPFLEQLKIVIFAELITLNDSTFEHFNLLATTDERYNEILNERNEFIVEPTVLSTMIILAKFLGFVIALPYQSATMSTNETSNNNAALIQSHQLKLRQLFHEPFDICQLLDEAISSGRYLITLPWLVQYMAMLDDVTLQLKTNLNALKKMFKLYIKLGVQQHFMQQQTIPISSFIIRCCLGWLFEQKPFIANEYYNFRATFNFKANEDLTSNTKTLALTNTIKLLDAQTNAILESALTVACPYLADFRVSIMPAKYALTKYVSRSGRYRHITPCIAEIPNSSNKTVENVSIDKQTDFHVQQSIKLPAKIITDKKQRQRKLMESFLHAQNSSMRRLIVFLTERTYKCVIKDAQHQFLIPSKSAADGLVNEITDSNYDKVFTKVTQIYRNARIETIEQWDIEVPNMLKKRVLQGLEALLPLETAPIVKQAYAWRIQSDANIKIEQWRHMNLFKNDFYCNDIQELTEKLCKANINRPKQISTTQSTELKLIKGIPSISDLLEEMQNWMYTTSGSSKFQPEHWSTSTLMNTTIDELLIDYLSRLTASFENVLPTIYYRLIGSGLIQVIQHLIAIRPENLTPKLIKALCNFFKDQRMQNADERIQATTISNVNNNSPKNNPDQITKDTQKIESSTTAAVTSIYNALITPPFIESLGAQRFCFDKLKMFLFSMIENNLISIDYLNELFISVFKQDLNCNSFNEISRILSELSQEINYKRNDANNETDADDIQKSKLFMEILADFSRDADNF